MSDRALDAACHECGAPLSPQPWEERAVRCASCFDGYLRAIDLEFLASYAELGVTSRRTVAETCLRGLVLENAPARKILAMAIMDQFLLASGDLIGLHHAIKHRDEQPIIRTFLSFRLDGESSERFFRELLESPDEELLAGLGLPAPSTVAARCPELPPNEVRELSGALASLVRDLRTTAKRTASAVLLSELAESAPGGRGSAALASKASWLGNGTLRPDQVASLVLDERRRQLVAHAVSVDEHQLGEVVDAIDCMTRAASNMIYAYLTMADLEADA